MRSRPWNRLGVSVVTDGFGTHDVYYTRCGDVLVVSSSLAAGVPLRSAARRTDT